MAHTCVWCKQTAGIACQVRYVQGDAETRLFFCNETCAAEFFKKNEHIVREVSKSELLGPNPSKAVRNGWR